MRLKIKFKIYSHDSVGIAVRVPSTPHPSVCAQLWVAISLDLHVPIVLVQWRRRWRLGELAAGVDDLLHVEWADVFGGRRGRRRLRLLLIRTSIERHIDFNHLNGVLVRRCRRGASLAFNHIRRGCRGGRCRCVRRESHAIWLTICQLLKFNFEFRAFFWCIYRMVEENLTCRDFLSCRIKWWMFLVMQTHVKWWQRGFLYFFYIFWVDRDIWK